ncbi:MAG: hypothetical protein ACOYOK_09630 [Pseudobdellovibrionaceae bacterium]
MKKAIISVLLAATSFNAHADKNTCGIYNTINDKVISCIDEAINKAPQYPDSKFDQIELAINKCKDKYPSTLADSNIEKELVEKKGYTLVANPGDARFHMTLKERSRLARQFKDSYMIRIVDTETKEVYLKESDGYGLVDQVNNCNSK